MNIAEFSVKNRILVNLFTVFIYIAGIFAMFQLRREAFPNVSFDTVTITTVYAGAPAEDVEKLVTIPIEKELKEVSGVKEITSSSDEGFSIIGIELEPENTDKRKVIDDIRRAVDRVDDLPADVKDPEVIELSTKEHPIIEISISGPVSEVEKRQYAESLEDKILDIDGVAKVNRFGWRDREFWVELDTVKMQEFYVSLDEVQRALKTRNITIPGGQIITDTAEYNVRITGEFKTPAEIENVIIRANDSGNWLRVKDVGRVVDALEDETRIAKINGYRTVAMVVMKRELADSITVTDQVKEVIEEFKKTLPATLQITLSNDYSYYVKRRLGVVISNGIFGFFFVIFVLFLFMDPFPAIMTAMGIPFALLATFMIMNWMGMSINLITMLGLIIVLGMLVDDGIVVCENVYRYVEKGMTVKDAVIKGTDEVIVPIIGTITTTWAAFLPLMLMTDIIGKFVREIPIVIIIALAASMFEAFIALPSHLADFMKPPRKDKLGHLTDHSHKPWYLKLLNGYTNILKSALANRYKVMGGASLVFVGAILIAVFWMKIILFTGEGIEYFTIRAEAKKGTPLAKMDELIKPVEQLAAAIPTKELENYRSYLGSIEEEGGFDPSAKRGAHLGQVTVYLTPMQKRNRKPAQIIESLRPKLEKISGFEKLYFFKPKEGPPVGAPVSVAVKGDDYAILQDIASKYVAELKEIKGVSDIASSYEFGKKQLTVMIDEDRAQKFYLSIDEIAKTVHSAFEGGLATTIKPERAEEEIDVKVRFPELQRNSKDAFEKILIPNRFDKLISLKNVATIKETEGVYLITHLDGKRVIYVTANVDDKYATSLGVNTQLKKKFQGVTENHLGYSVKYAGEYEENQTTQKNLLFSMFLALFLIFIILAWMFNSMLEPFIVMLAVPFGLVGVIITFFLHGRPLSFFAFMGLVGLTGVVVNNSIVLVEFINKLRAEGQSKFDSIIEAAQIRLRPILMTTITTVGGLVSVAYGIGGGDPFLKPMALALMWGLTFSTILTLVLLPCIYAIIDDLSEKFFKKALVPQSKS
jgi:multidrug efflux pump subunit AcrB